MKNNLYYLPTRKHWDDDRADYLVEEFLIDEIGGQSGDEAISGAMLYWLDIDEHTPVNEENMVKAFYGLDRDVRYGIMVTYVEAIGEEYAFDRWYRDKFDLDEEEDILGDGIMDDMYDERRIY